MNKIEQKFLKYILHQLFISKKLIKLPIGSTIKYVMLIKLTWIKVFKVFFKNSSFVWKLVSHLNWTKNS